MKNTDQKKRRKRVLPVFLVILGVVVLALVGTYLYADNSVYIQKNYNTQIQTGGEIEAHYLQSGDFATKKKTASAEKPIGKYTIYYPAELETSETKYPMLLVVNGTGGKATRYEPEFELYASWGFIAVGTQDKGTGSGQTTVETLYFMLEQNENPNSVFYQKIDVDNIGITGFSQGGAAVFNVLTKFEESKYFKTAVPLSPVSERTAETMTDYPYDSADVKCPIMVLAGTKGEFETETVIPLSELQRQYEKITTPKLMARRIGMTHEDMMYSAGGYVIAWFRWQLMGDTYAAGAFTGEAPEILSNALYQDQRIDIK